MWTETAVEEGVNMGAGEIIVVSGLFVGSLLLAVFFEIVGSSYGGLDRALPEKPRDP